MQRRQQRQQRLLQLIRAHTRSAGWLAGQLGISVRTVFRDIELLRAQGHEIDGLVGRHGGFRLGDDGPVQLRLRVDQVRELVGALGWATHHGALLSTLDVAPLLEQLLGALPGVRERGLRTLFPAVTRPFRSTQRATPAHLDALEAAVQRGQHALLAYRHGRRGTHAFGAPIALRPGAGGWILDLVTQSIGRTGRRVQRRRVPLASLRSVRPHPRPAHTLLRQEPDDARSEIVGIVQER